jgi:hypothetical protein
VRTGFIFLVMVGCLRAIVPPDKSGREECVPYATELAHVTAREAYEHDNEYPIKKLPVRAAFYEIPMFFIALSV